MPKKRQYYSGRAFSDTKQLQAKIVTVATALNLNPEAIFGALVEENHDFHDEPTFNFLGDQWSKNYAHHDIKRFYEAVAAQLDQKPSAWDKIKNPVLNDVGPFNIKLGTAIRVLKAYLSTTPAGQDPLGLKKYAEIIPY